MTHPVEQKAGESGELERLSKAAVGGQWRVSTTHWGSIGIDSMVSDAEWDGNRTVNGKPNHVVVSDACAANECVEYSNAALIVALVNAYRSGLLSPSVAVPVGGEGTGASFGPDHSASPSPSVSALTGECSSRGQAEQSCLDAAAAIEGIAQELDAYGRTAQGHMLRQALDTLLGVSTDASMSPADDGTRRIVGRAWARFQAGVALGTEAGTAKTEGLGPKDEGPATSVATPDPSPLPDPITKAQAVLDDSSALRARIGELEEILAFYADDQNYRLNGPMDPNSGWFEGSTRAQAALAKMPAGKAPQTGGPT